MAESSKTPREIVDLWFNETFRNSVVARDTEVWNFVHKSKDDLVARLESKSATAAPAPPAGSTAGASTAAKG
jgi:hypothetical protein